MEKEILYKIVLDWYNATVVGADGFDEECGNTTNIYKNRNKKGLD